MNEYENLASARCANLLLDPYMISNLHPLVVPHVLNIEFIVPVADETGILAWLEPALGVHVIRQLLLVLDLLLLHGVESVTESHHLKLG